MKRKRDFLDYLNDILDAVEKIERFTAGMNFNQFAHDEKTVFAVVRALEIVGEATKNIPLSVRRRYVKVPWKKMAGMRDKVIHEYFGVDLKVVWKTVRQDAPDLKPLIARVIEQETQKEQDKDV